MSTIQNTQPHSQPESKSAKKKKAKAEAPAHPSAAISEPDAAAGHTATDGASNGADGVYESPYLKELYKNIRNIKKKLNATQKVDSIIAENSGSTLDELLAARKINQDQKAQAQKKPSLQASLNQLEEQIAQYKQFDEDYQKRLLTEKSALESAHKDELRKVKDAAVAETEGKCKDKAKNDLLVLSKFLRAAAAKRQGGNESSAENLAFEGALLLVYGGEASAVVAMENLVSGSEEIVPTIDGVPSEFAYKQVRDLAFEYAPYAAEEAWAEEVAQSEPAPPAAEEPSMIPVETDPTVAHAGLTELDDPTEPTTNGTSHHVDTPTVPDASNIDAGAANAAAGSNWDVKSSGEADWMEVAQRDPAETDTGNKATPAAMSGTQSWAEDVPSSMPTPAYIQTPPTNEGDGFHEVSHHRGGRGRGGAQGEHRGGNRGRGGFRGDRGEGGGRGRGGHRGDRGGGDGERRGGRGRGGGFRGNRGRGDAAQ